MARNRLRQAQRILAERLESNAATIAHAITRGATVLFENVPVVRNSYNKTVRTEYDSEDSAQYHVFLISTARVPELLEGDLMRIDNETFRVTRDHITGQTWRPHGEHGTFRAYFFVLWGTV